MNRRGGAAAGLAAGLSRGLVLGLLLASAAAGVPACAADPVASPAPQRDIGKRVRALFVAGHIDAAVALRRQALAAAIARDGVASSPATAAMTGLARLYLDQNRYLDAEPLLLAAERSLAERTLADRGGGEAAAQAEALTGLARIAAARGDTEAAIDRGRRAVALASRQGEAAGRRALGAALAAAHRFDAAEPVLQRALALDREQRDGGIELARSLAQLADLYLHAGRPAEALPLIEEATAIDQERLAPGHPRIGDDLHDLALVYEALKRPEAALRMLNAALAALERGEARDTPRVAYVESDLSRLLRQAGDENSAEAAFRDARRILNKAEAEEHKRERQV